jgi:hypothetical protein
VERVAPRAAAVRLEKKLDSAQLMLIVPNCVLVEVSRVQRVTLRDADCGPDSPTKITAVLVTVSVPNAKDRILVFPAE